MSSDDPHRAVEEIRRNLRVFGAEYADESRLLAALDEVLKLPATWEALGDPGLSVLEEDRAWVRQACAADLRAAIASALLGEEAGNG